MKTLSSLLGNSQRLDGGAMFGNAPKAVWSRWVDVDTQNQIALACRCLLVREANRNILLEVGVGAFFAPELAQRYGIVEREHRLLDELARVGLSHHDIDVIVLSHLHFDHAGGLLQPWREDYVPELLFPNAQLVVSEGAWARAKQPHPRDRASFIPELPELLTASGRLHVLSAKHSELLGEDYVFHTSDGHTPGMLLTEIQMPAGPVVFAADLIPGVPWTHLPITMGYDRYPEALIDEKQRLLEDLESRRGRLFFTHDTDVAMGRVVRDQKGRFSVADRQPAITDLAE